MPEHAGWQSTTWWRVTDADGDIVTETDIKQDALDAMSPGHRLYRLFTLSQEKWVPQNV